MCIRDRKDIYYLLKVEKEEVFSNLVRLIASQTGMIVNYAELSSTLGISYRTLRSYLWYLEKTFILDKVTPFFKNTRKEITKSPVFYFIDLGMRNFANGSFDWGGVQNADFVFQNFIYNILSDKLKEKMAKINFWRTKDGAEVDFVVLVGSEEFPIEVKNRHLEKVEGNRSLMSYIEKYHPKKAIVVNLSLQGQKKVKGTQLIAIPYWFDFTKIF